MICWSVNWREEGKGYKNLQRQVEIGMKEIDVAFLWWVKSLE